MAYFSTSSKPAGKVLLAVLIALLISQAAVPARAEPDSTLLPLPVFATSRNGGNEYGVMPVWLLTENEYIYGIVAPSAIYNENTGLNLTFRYLGYPTVDKNYAIFINKAIGVDQEATGEYRDKKFMDGRFRLFARFYYQRDSTFRFFGFTEASENDDEVNYSNVEMSPQAELGYYLPNNFTISLREKFRWVYIRRGKLDSLPYLKSSQFRGIDGANGGAVLNNRLKLTYDSRDDEVYPAKGWLANVYGEVNHSFTGHRWYTRAGVDAMTFISFNDKRFTTVLKAAVELTGGRHVPFFERSTLGGEKTLRGYGLYRFTDDGYVLLNLEERIRLFRLHIFGVWSDWEAAPFVDMGRVFSSFRNEFFQHYKVNPGIGFRAIVEPNVVGRVDIGYSDDGIEAFVGLDFPF